MFFVKKVYLCKILKKMYQQKKILLLLSCIVFLITETAAQEWKYNRSEVIIGTGASNFLGELGGKDGVGTNDLKDFNLEATRPLLHVGHSYRLTPNIAWVNDLTFGYLTGNDAHTNEDFRKNRNIHFRTPIFEFASTINYFPFTEREGARYTLTGYRMKEKKRRGVEFFQKLDYDIFPYIFGGIAVFYFNPQAKYPEDGDIVEMRGEWVNLKPLRTEGQGIIPTRDEYSLVQISIPMGLGFKYIVDRTFSIGLEYGIRLTFTDYIDDTSTTYVDPEMLKEYHGGQKGELAAYFSNPTQYNLQSSITTTGQQRGDIRDNDAYMFAKITLYYKITDRTTIPVPKFR